MTDGFERIGGDAIDPVGNAPDDPGEGPNSRRRLFKMGAIGVAAVGAAAVGNALTSGQAGAASGDDLLIGDLNTVTDETNVTALEGGQLWVINNDLSLAAIRGVNGSGVGVQGVAQSNNVGVQGQALLATPGSIGVQGTGVVGVQGTTIGSGTPSTQGPGVLGIGNSTGVGIQAQNTAGASLRLDPFGTTTLPATSAPGQFIVLSDGSLHYSYAGNTWKPMTSTVQIDPVRVIDTVSGLGGISGPLAPGATVHTSTAIGGSHGIPVGATGVVGNFAISGAGGALLNGYGVATIFPAGTGTPATANINAGAGCFAISNAVSVALGTGGSLGKVSMVWGGGGPVPHVQAFLDITGYIL